jgi:hypothetical protein
MRSTFTKYKEEHQWCRSPPPPTYREGQDSDTLVYGEKLNSAFLEEGTPDRVYVPRDEYRPTPVSTNRTSKELGRYDDPKSKTSMLGPARLLF